MSTKKTKPAAASASRKQKTPAAKAAAVINRPSNEQAARATIRGERLAAYYSEGKRLQEAYLDSKDKPCSKFTELDHLELAAVLALADLLSYASHNTESLDDAPNWLGAFLGDLLLEVAASGPQEMNARPGDVKHFFDKAIENLRDTMNLCSNMTMKIPISALREIENWPTGPQDATA